jgi:hypothetical protein
MILVETETACTATTSTKIGKLAGPKLQGLLIMLPSQI